MNEINTRQPTILFVGKEPGPQELRLDKPFQGVDGQQLNDFLARAGLLRSQVNLTYLSGVRYSKEEDFEAGSWILDSLIKDLRPSLVVTFGNEAAFSMGINWPSRDGTFMGAKSIKQLRGYVWYNDECDVNVLTTIRPFSTLQYQDPSGINSFIFQQDLVKARRISKEPDFTPPQRTIFIVDNENLAKNSGAIIREKGLVAADIECSGTEKLLCVGFATSPLVSYVYTEACFDQAFEILRNKNVSKIFHNGHFDTYFLSTRCNVETEGFNEDTSLLWHALWPEIAGDEDGKSEKSLRFLTSLVTDAPYYKNYSDDPGEMYQLNGLDCCVTYEIWESLLVDAKERGVEETYRHEVALVEVLVKMQERGISIDTALLDERVLALTERADVSYVDILALVEPLLHERRELLDKPHLIFKTYKCKCCRGAKKKMAACWSCAGFDGPPKKSVLLERYPKMDPHEKLTSLKAQVLHTCKVCKGKGEFEEFIFNPGSPDQMADVMYNVLKVAPRRNKGKVTVDEKALKQIRGAIS